MLGAGCQGYSAEDLALIRHIGVNLLSQEEKAKIGIKNKRLKAGWDNRYPETVLRLPQYSYFLNVKKRMRFSWHDPILVFRRMG